MIQKEVSLFLLFFSLKFFLLLVLILVLFYLLGRHEGGTEPDPGRLSALCVDLSLPQKIGVNQCIRLQKREMQYERSGET